MEQTVQTLNLDFYTRVMNIAAEERVITNKQYFFVDSALLVGFSVSGASSVEIGAYAGLFSPVLLLDGVRGSILVTGG